MVLKYKILHLIHIRIKAKMTPMLFFTSHAAKIKSLATNRLVSAVVVEAPHPAQISLPEDPLRSRVDWQPPAAHLLSALALRPRSPSCPHSLLSTQGAWNKATAAQPGFSSKSNAVLSSEALPSLSPFTSARPAAKSEALYAYHSLLLYLPTDVALNKPVYQSHLGISCLANLTWHSECVGKGTSWGV